MLGPSGQVVALFRARSRFRRLLLSLQFTIHSLIARERKPSGTARNIRREGHHRVSFCEMIVVGPCGTDGSKSKQKVLWRGHCLSLPA